MRASDVWDRVASAGIAAQGAVPGLYAWGVTVVPVAWVRGGPGAAKVAAIAAPLALGAGVAGERVWGDVARLASLWGFVVASAATWALARGGLGPLHLDGPRGVAGMLGWALFAFTFAGPALRGGSNEEDSATPRGRSVRAFGSAGAERRSTSGPAPLALPCCRRSGGGSQGRSGPCWCGSSPSRQVSRCSARLPRWLWRPARRASPAPG